MITSRQAMMSYGALIFAMLVLALGLSLADSDLLQVLLREDGPVELLTCAAYTTCTLYMLLEADNSFLSRYHHLVVVPIAFGLRELDFDRRFTQLGIFSSKFLFSPIVPVYQKLLGGCVIAAALYVIWRLCRYHWRAFVTGLRQRSEPLSAGTGLALLLIVLSQSLDGLDRKLGDIGIHISQGPASEAVVFEETFELGIPFVFLIMAAYYFTSRQSRPA
ncbi:MAG: hypothetical protein REI94_02145 [Moraxellaceae bacterium]|nr:hypothetical protein [Moraxellaceae bacterium]